MHYDLNSFENELYNFTTLPLMIIYSIKKIDL